MTVCATNSGRVRIPNFEFQILNSLLLLLCLLAVVPGSRGASLAERHEIRDGTFRRTFVISTNEIHLRRADGVRETRAVVNATTAEAVRQQALVLSLLTGGEAELILYAEGAPRNNDTRRILTKDILVRLAPGTDPAALAAASGTVSGGPVSYAPGWHIFKAQSTGGALEAAAVLRAGAGVLSSDPQLARQMALKSIPNDPLFANQWHLRNTGQNGGTAGMDVNVTNVWNTYRGAGVTIAIVDDGLQVSHPDLAPNVNLSLGLDLNGNDNDPSPNVLFDFHGTAVAGVAAARGNNSLGVSGAAYEATLAGIRLIAGPATDAEEGQAMTHSNQVIFVSNNSWGPPDDGQTLQGPGPLMLAAFQQGTTSGRAGRGTIFMWAAGNGGSSDNANFDGYANSIYTFAVGALNDRGDKATYSEAGANLIITAPAGGDSVRPQATTTTDLVGNNGYNSSATPADYADKDYTSSFNGTSSASPLAAGVVALILQANPNLTWRDLKEILIRSATKNSPADTDWATNSAGFRFNHKFGPGLINAEAAVNLATTWNNLGPQLTASYSFQGGPISIPDNNLTGITQTFTVTNASFRLEHVTLTVDITHPYRGDIVVELISPSGMVSRMAEVRGFDSNNDFTGWTFSSVRHWGEFAQGTWTVRIVDAAALDLGSLNTLRLDFFASAYAPVTDNILEVSVFPPTGSTVFGGTNFNLLVTVNDTIPVTDAFVFLSVVDAMTNTVFTNIFVPNDGIPPDAISGDNVYTYSLSNVVNGTYIFYINTTAPGKQPDQTIVSYSVLNAPPNDALANSLKIAASGQMLTGYTHFASVEAFEPVHAGVAGVANSIWFTFAPTNSGRVLVDPGGSTLDTVVAVYTGLTMDALVLIAATNDVTAINSPTNNPRGWLYFDALAGETYQIAVAGVPPLASGNVSLRVFFDGVPDTNAPSLTITAPASGLITTNGAVTLSGTATDGGLFASGILIVEVSQNGQFPVPALSSNGFATWSQRVLLAPGTNQLRIVAVDNAGNRSAPRNVDVTYRVFDPPNDLFAMSRELLGTNGVIAMNTVKATKEIGEPNHAGNNGGKSIWYRFVATADGSLRLSTTNSNFDTVMAVYTGSQVSALASLAFNDDGVPPFRHSVITLAVRAGTTYHIAVDGLGGAAGTAFLSHDFAPTAVFDLSITVSGNGSVSIPAGAYTNGSLLTLRGNPAPNHDFISWSGALNTLDNPIVVNLASNTTLTATFLPKIFSDDFETGSLTNLPWSAAGNVGWTAGLTNASETNTGAGGRYFARSGVIGNNQTSTLRLVASMIAGPGQFSYRVSTEAGHDFFSFSLNGTVLTNISGESGWQVFTFNVPAGTNTLEWKFAKDPSFSEGLDAVFIDNVELPVVIAKDFSVPVTLSNFFISAGAPGSVVPQFRVSGQTNQIYHVQGSADLFNWETIVTNIARHGLIQFTDPQATNFPTRYYRVIVP